MNTNDWTTFEAICQGTPDQPHFPVRMDYSRDGQGIRDGALFLCTSCGERKFVWRTWILGTLKWRWA